MPDSAENNVACRICMNPKDQYVSLFFNDLSRKVMELADVQVEKEDGLPENICAECEKELEKCYEFRLKVQVADKKFRKCLGLKFAQVDLEEHKIKEENYINEDSSDNEDDTHSVCMDEENDHEPEDSQRISEETEEATPDPLNHVQVVQENEKAVEMAEDPIAHTDLMVKQPQITLPKIEEVSVDQFACMKQESEVDIMDIDCNQPDPFGPSSSVISRKASSTNSYLPEGSSSQTEGQGWFHISQALPLTDLPFTPVFTFETLSSVHSEEIISPIEKTSEAINCQKPSNIAHTRDARLNLNVKVHSSHEGGSACKMDSNFVLSSNRKIQTRSSVNKKNKGSKTKPVVSEAENELRTEDENTAPSDESKKFSDAKALDDPDRMETESEVLSGPSDVKKPTNKSFCSVCYVDCGSVELLQEHKDRIGFICRRCTSKFDTHSDLEIHFFNHSQYTCETCNEVFYFKKDLYRHRDSEKCLVQLKYYDCEICSRRFRKNSVLKLHMWTHKNVEKKEVCIVCRRTFKSSQLLLPHLSKCHVAYEYIECSTCHRLFLGPMKLRRHIQKIHIEPSEEDKMACPTCGKIFSNKSYMSRHILDKHDDTEYVCTVCGESVKGKIAMERHTRNKHAKQPFTCTRCDQQFETASKLLNHKRKHLKEEQPPEVAFCEICGKTYKSREIYKRHLRNHSDEKPFKCDVCGAAFKQRVTLKTHSRVHNSVGKYICNRCGLSFNWKQTFDKHINICESKSDNTVDSS